MKKGIIRENVAITEPEAFGSWIAVVVMVQLTSERIEDNRYVKDLISKEYLVQQHYHVLGEAGFVLLVLAPSISDFEDSSARVLISNDKVAGFQSSL